MKLLYVWAKLSIDSKSELDEIIGSISDKKKKEISLNWLVGNLEKTSVSDIIIWNYQVIPYQIEHYLKIKCSHCGTELSRKLSFDIARVSGEKKYLCTNCFTGYEFTDGLLSDYFNPKFLQPKTNGVMLNRPPKIAFVMRYTDIMGGGVKVAYKHMQWLSDLGCEITIYSDAPKPEWINLPGKFIRVKDHYEINNINADTVIVFSVYDVPKILTKVDNGKVYHICQGYEGYHIGRNYNEMRSDKYFYTTLHSFKVGNILVSNHLINMFDEKIGRKGHYIPNAIDLNTYFPNPKIRKEPNSILFVGNPNDPLKGFQFLNDALSKLQSSSERFENLNLYIVWGGTKLNGEEKEKEIAGIKIHYLTGLSGNEVAALMNRVSLVVNCSWYEGFTLPVLESMACGTPTITTSNMGAESFCIHGENSFIVNYGDFNSLIERIKDILLHRIDIHSLIRNGFDTAVEYSGFNGATKFIDEYSAILHYEFDKMKVAYLIGTFDNDIETLNYKLESKLKSLNNSGHPEVSIILVTYNQIKYTLECIDSIRKYTKIPYEIILVDNASIDETVQEIEKYDDIILIKNDYNLGFPSAVNQGIKAAMGKNILLLNNDVVLTEGWLERMLELVKSNPVIGIVGPISNIVSGVQLDKNAKYNSIEEMHKYTVKIKKENKGQFFEFPRVAFLCTLIKREVIDKIGGLDERFSPGNFEDDDFCLRAQLAGYKTVIAQDVFIHHYGSKSFKANGAEEYAKRLEHNKQVFIDKWGADPEEIWLKGKTFNKRNPAIPIDVNPFAENMKRAMIYLNDKDFEQALIYLNEAVDCFGKYSRIGYEHLELIDILNLAGNTALMNGELEQAQQYFEKELQQSPTSSRACAGLAEVFFAAENYEAAKTMFEWSLKNDESNVNAKSGLKKVNGVLQLEEEHNSLES